MPSALGSIRSVWPTLGRRSGCASGLVGTDSAFCYGRGMRAVSALGILVMLGLAFLLCPRERRRHVKLRPVLFGVGLLLVLAALLLRTPLHGLFFLANAAVERLLGFAREGAIFVFGRLVA